jgi:hypothetical protein
MWLALDALPPVMASHFDARGKPDGFQSRTSFFVTCALLQLGRLALFAALPWLMRRMPTRLLNLPHREHWLAPERKAQSITRAATLLDAFALATLALMAATFELALRANLRGGPLESSAMWLLLAAYLAFSLFWMVRFMRAFPAPGSAQAHD